MLKHREGQSYIVKIKHLVALKKAPIGSNRGFQR